MPSTAELDPAQRAPAEQPGIGTRIVGRIGSMAHTAKEAVSNTMDSIVGSTEQKMAAFAIAAVGLTGATAQNNDSNVDAEKAALSAFNPITRTADSFGQPEMAQVSTTPEAQNSSLRQDCVRAGLRMPKISRSRSIVSRPGDRKKQLIRSSAYYRPMPEQCHGVYRRVPKVKLQLQNPRNHKRWFNVIPYSAPNLYKPPNPEAESLRVGDEGGLAGVEYFPYPFEIRDNRKRYRCTPGKGVTHVRALYKSMVRDIESSEIIARSRIRKVPIRVRPIKPGTDYRGAVPGPC